MIPEKGLCYECDSSYEIVPPSDLEYCVPREQPKTKDYLSKTYQCDDRHHRNPVYWERKDYATVFDSWQSTRHYENLDDRRKRLDTDLARYYHVTTPFQKEGN